MTALQFYPITEIIRTKQEAQSFILDIHNLTDSLFNIKTNINEKIDQFLTYNRKDKILELCQQNNVNMNDIQSFRDFLSSVIAYIESIPVITLKIAYEPKSEDIQAMSSSVVGGMQKDILIDITVDDTIIGGAIVAVDGIYKDYSVKKKLEGKLKPENLVNLLNTNQP